MPQLGNYKPDSEKLCSRCQSKRKISKKWTEKIANSNGFMTLEHTQYICTNKECQAEFDKTMLAEEEKRVKLKQARTADAAKRTSVK